MRLARRFLVGVLAVVLTVGGLPRAEAVPAAAGSIEAGADLYSFCFQSATCAPFFAAGCPDALVRPDGAIGSIVDLTPLRGKTVRFSWSDVGTDFYDEHIGTLGTLTPRSGQLSFFIVSSCEQPVGLPTFIIATTPSTRSRIYTVPLRARWAIVLGLPGVADATWSAQ